MAAATPEQARLLDGRYLLAEQVGRGGMADVYRARDQVLNRDVAVKVFRAVPGEADRKRYEVEVSTLASLRHPGLVLLFDAGTDDAGRPYAVMQLLAGRSLADRDEDVRMPVARVAEIGAALAEALAFVHAHGVVHRDVKPANVLLDERGAPLLADFGIARSLDSTGVTGTGLTVGTAAYMAPEQVRGEPVSGAADVYALGLMLLECLTGYREYEGSAIEAALARLTRPPRLPDFVPPVWQSLISHMTAAEPADRPTATQVGEWLRGDTALRGEDVWVPPARSGSTDGSRPALSGQRTRLAGGAAAAAGMADSTTGGFPSSTSFGAARTGMDPVRTGSGNWRGEQSYTGAGTGAGFPAPPAGAAAGGYDDGTPGRGRGRILVVALVGIVAVGIFAAVAAIGLGGTGGSTPPATVVPGQTQSAAATPSSAGDATGSPSASPGGSSAPPGSAAVDPGTGQGAPASVGASAGPTTGTTAGPSPQPSRSTGPTKKPPATTPPTTTPPTVATTPPVVTTPPVTPPPVTTPPVSLPTKVTVEPNPK